MRPTKGRVEQARALLKQTAGMGFRPAGRDEALRVLLAATEPVEPPTDLVEEMAGVIVTSLTAVDLAREEARAAARAVLAYLAGQAGDNEEWLPGEEEAAEFGAEYGDNMAAALRQYFAFAAAPVMVAKSEELRAALAEQTRLSARVAELEKLLEHAATEIESATEVIADLTDEDEDYADGIDGGREHVAQIRSALAQSLPASPGS